MIKKTLTTLSIAAMAATVVQLPTAVSAAEGPQTGIQLAACKAACKPCAANAAACNPCKAKAACKACSPCKAKAACKPCSPCKATKK